MAEQLFSEADPMAASAFPAKAICVDASCLGNPGPMEYRGVDLHSREVIFHYGPVLGTNNIGEFLAIVHALALLEQQGDTTTPIYSDSITALAWIRQRKCKTKLPLTPETQPLFKVIKRAESWLLAHQWTNPILKWNTQEWGEVPADFGRK